MDEVIWKSGIQYWVIDDKGRKAFKIDVEWDAISPKKVGIQEDLLMETLAKFKKVASSA